MTPMELSGALGWVLVIALNLALTAVYIFVRLRNRR